MVNSLISLGTNIGVGYLLYQVDSKLLLAFGFYLFSSVLIKVNLVLEQREQAKKLQKELEKHGYSEVIPGMFTRKDKDKDENKQ